MELQNQENSEIQEIPKDRSDWGPKWPRTEVTVHLTYKLRHLPLLILSDYTPEVRVSNVIFVRVGIVSLVSELSLTPTRPRSTRQNTT